MTMRDQCAEIIDKYDFFIRQIRKEVIVSGNNINRAFC